jgi:hypothetical protein
MALIEDIRIHILDPKFPITAILREAVVLARKLRSNELTTSEELPAGFHFQPSRGQCGQGPKSQTSDTVV